jgi:hypothetical protein
METAGKGLLELIPGIGGSVNSSIVISSQKGKIKGFCSFLMG